MIGLFLTMLKLAVGGIFGFILGAVWSGAPRGDESAEPAEWEEEA